jgi:hypothetical protein
VNDVGCVVVPAFSRARKYTSAGGPAVVTDVAGSVVPVLDAADTSSIGSPDATAPVIRMQCDIRHCDPDQVAV